VDIVDQEKVLNILRRGPKEGLSPSEIMHSLFFGEPGKRSMLIRRNKRQEIDRFLHKKAKTDPELFFIVDEKSYCHYGAEDEKDEQDWKGSKIQLIKLDESKEFIELQVLKELSVDERKKLNTYKKNKRQLESNIKAEIWGRKRKWVFKSDISPEIHAMVLALTSKFTSFFLPERQRKIIDDLMLKDSKQQGLDYEDSAWLESVAVVPRYPKIFPKLPIDYLELEAVILRALKERAGFSAKYLTGKKKTYFPVRLVRREWVSYIVCTEEALNPIYKEYAIHRFKQCEFIKKPSNSKLNYNAKDIEKALVSGVTGVWGELEYLVLEISGPPAQHLSEMRFHEKESPSNGQYTKSTTLETDENRISRVQLEIFGVPYTYELKTWILGLGAYCLVLESKSKNNNIDVRGDIVETIKSMNNKYL